MIRQGIRYFSSAPHKVAITGSSGIVGSRIYRLLQQDGWECVGITSGRNVSQGGPGRSGESCIDETLVDRIADLRDGKKCEGVFEGCSHVIHLAAQGHPGASFEDVLSSNVIATFNVLEEAKRANVQRVVFASTNHTQHGSSCARPDAPGSVDHSRLGGRLMKTGDVAFPDSHYAASKLYCEDLGKLYSQQYGFFEFVSLRIGWILYDDPTELQGTEFFDYLLAMFLSQRDCYGFHKAALEVPMKEKYMCTYAISNNTRKVFDLEETINLLGYTPLDNSEDFLQNK